MVFISVLVLFAVWLANTVEANSHQSMWTDGGHPILRASPTDDVQLTEPPHEKPYIADLRARIRQLIAARGAAGAQPYIQELVKETEKKHKVELHVKVKRHDNGRRFQNEPFFINQLRYKIRTLVDRFGYRAARSRIQQAVFDTEAKYDVLMHVKVRTDGSASIYHVLAGDLRDDSHITSTTTDQPTRRPDPEWLASLKTTFNEALWRLGQKELMRRLEPYANYVFNVYGIDIKKIEIEDIGMKLDDSSPLSSATFEDQASEKPSYIQNLDDPKPLWRLYRHYKKSSPNQYGNPLSHVVKLFNKISKRRTFGTPVHSLRRKKTEMRGDSSEFSVGESSAEEQKPSDNGGGFDSPNNWIKELQNYVKNLVNTYNPDNVRLIIMPAIKYIEQKHGVKISDLDVLKNGLISMVVDGKPISGRRKLPDFMIPEWVYKFKNYVQGLIRRHDFDEAMVKAEKWRKILERDYHVQIYNIYVDKKTGELHMTIRKGKTYYMGGGGARKQGVVSEEPEWVPRFKIYIQYLEKKVGFPNLANALDPVISRLENKYNLKIRVDGTPGPQGPQVYILGPKVEQSRRQGKKKMRQNKDKKVKKRWNKRKHKEKKRNNQDRLVNYKSEWAIDLGDYITALIPRYGRNEILRHLEPVIEVYLVHSSYAQLYNAMQSASISGNIVASLKVYPFHSLQCNTYTFDGTTNATSGNRTS